MRFSASCAMRGQVCGLLRAVCGGAIVARSAVCTRRDVAGAVCGAGYGLVGAVCGCPERWVSGLVDCNINNIPIYRDVVI